MNQNTNILDLFFEIYESEEEIYMALLSEVLNLTPMSIWDEETQQLSIHIYIKIEDGDFIKKNLKLKLKELEQKGILKFPNIKENLLLDEDWMHSWKKYFYPIIIENIIQITPSWFAANSSMINLFLEPKMGFGTGQHATTYLCLKKLVNIDLKEFAVIDIGAGSGILGVAALLLGAKKATLLEVDALAVESCEDTVIRNGVAERAEVLLGDIFDLDEKIAKQNYNIAFINIIAEVICDILPLPFIKNIPLMILSGILVVKLPIVKEVLIKEGYEILEEDSQNEWISLTVKQI